jgi:hypothetical protein
MLKDRRMRGVKEPTEQSALGDYKLYADDLDSQDKYPRPK